MQGHVGGQGVPVNDSGFIPFPAYKSHCRLTMAFFSMRYVFLALKPPKMLTSLNWFCHHGDNLHNYVSEGSPTDGCWKVNFNGRLWLSASLFTLVLLHVRWYVTMQFDIMQRSANARDAFTTPTQSNIVHLQKSLILFYSLSLGILGYANRVFMFKCLL